MISAADIERYRAQACFSHALYVHFYLGRGEWLQVTEDGTVVCIREAPIQNPSPPENATNFFSATTVYVGGRKLENAIVWIPLPGGRLGYLHREDLPAIFGYEMEEWWEHGYQKRKWPESCIDQISRNLYEAGQSIFGAFPEKPRYWTSCATR